MTNIKEVSEKIKILPWFFLALFFAAAGAGSTGLYVGYQYASSKLTAVAARDRANLVTAYTVALEEKDARHKEMAARSLLVEKDFMSALKGMQVVNKTYNNEIQREVERTIYTDCKIPDSGVRLLNSHINEVNLRLVEGEK